MLWPIADSLSGSQKRATSLISKIKFGQGGFTNDKDHKKGSRVPQFYTGPAYELLHSLLTPILLQML